MHCTYCVYASLCYARASREYHFLPERRMHDALFTRSNLHTDTTNAQPYLVHFVCLETPKNIIDWKCWTNKRHTTELHEHHITASEADFNASLIFFFDWFASHSTTICWRSVCSLHYIIRFSIFFLFRAMKWIERTNQLLKIEHCLNLVSCQACRAHIVWTAVVFPAKTECICVWKMEIFPFRLVF